ncbi:conserved hypothetical protein [Chthoniobacter flavus Ellin428]|uniref:Uncharacterized protein n=2 Tax=Chthoniobacter flavus TaxID=191863 RepID=B4DAP4_9BACT|nr:conserved hypothetical protein [Chthoniobacter flavus Ellin428]TCO92725.1 hypothetical protein EV701_1052 [Chthoniobacter flavus]
MRPANAGIAERFIKPNDRLSAFERLQIYNQQYWWRLLGALGEDFRGLRAVLGEGKFEKLAVAYLEACGSHSWTLRDLGSRLVAFLAERPEYTCPRTDLALDVARVEWARVLAFDDPEKPTPKAEQIAQTPPDRLRLQLQPYLNLLELGHPVDELMRKLKRTGAVAVSNAVSIAAPRQRETVSIRRSRAPIHLAVHRANFSVYYQRLDPEAFRLLQALRSGATLADACATAFAENKKPPEQIATDIKEWFARWMEFGWFSR